MRAYSVFKGFVVVAAGVFVAANLAAATSSRETLLGPTQTVTSRPMAFERLTPKQYEANRIGGTQAPSTTQADAPAFGYAVMERPTQGR